MLHPNHLFFFCLIFGDARNPCCNPKHLHLKLTMRFCNLASGKCRRESKPASKTLLLPCWLYKRGAADSAGLSRPICIDLKLPEAWLGPIEAASRHKRAVEGQKKIYESRLNFVLLTTTIFLRLPFFLSDGRRRTTSSRG